MIRVPQNRDEPMPPENPSHRFGQMLYPEDPSTGTDRTPDGGAATDQDVTAWLETAANFVGSRPKLCLAAALATGVVLGWIVKRR